MTGWTAIVLARGGEEDGMRSRLPTYLHPVAGKPLLWHALAALGSVAPRPSRVLVLTGPEAGPDALRDLPMPVEAEFHGRGGLSGLLAGAAGSPVLLADVRAYLDASALAALLRRDGDGWMAAEGAPLAARVEDADRLLALAAEADPLRAAAEALTPDARLPDAGTSLLVRDRADFGRVVRRVRDRLLRGLMDGGVTFLLPDTVLADVDVRVGRDTVVYPGVVLEGQTTVGEETVVGPGCRIIDSWVGSGVELKGWNYISRTSIRNRAILEPYVRRGFD